MRDVDYVVKDKTLLESIMDTEFFDASEKGIFYNGNILLVAFACVLFCCHYMLNYKSIKVIPQYFLQLLFFIKKNSLFVLYYIPVSPCFLT